MLKEVANEPSVGLYFVQQHVHKAVPGLLALKVWPLSSQLEDAFIDLWSCRDQQVIKISLIFIYAPLIRGRKVLSVSCLIGVIFISGQLINRNICCAFCVTISVTSLLLILQAEPCCRRIRRGCSVHTRCKRCSGIRESNERGWPPGVQQNDFHS